jgi:tRNA (guanine37-N1)-methyltransferase
MPHMLKDALASHLVPSELDMIFSAFDMIGDIVILKIPDCLLKKKNIIGDTILTKVKTAKSVFLQTSAVKGDFRLRNLEYLAGEYKTETEYKEHGCRFKVDIANVYFSPRLSSERLRVAQLVRNNEVITNMFGGIGTFSILIAKMNKTCTVYNIDSNVHAANLCKFNAKLNKVQDRVISILGDAAHVVETELSGTSHRVLMPLPERASEFVSSAVEALTDHKGIIHFFAHVTARNKKLGSSEGAISAKNAFKNYEHTLLQTKVVREVGPRLYQTVSDVQL